MTPPAERAILVPVKDLGRAKTRLSPLLSLEERRALAWLLLDGVLRQIAAADAAARKVVVTSHPPAMALARELGFAVIEEARQISESASVDAASAQLQAAGVTGLLRVPLDLPLLTAGDVARVLAEAAGGAAVVLVPSRDRRGTNALYRSPPTLFASQFGPDSLVLHERAARAAVRPRAPGAVPPGALGAVRPRAPGAVPPGAPGAVSVLPLAGFALDIDEPADVAELLRLGTPCPALDYLRGLDVSARLARMAREPA